MPPASHMHLTKGLQHLPDSLRSSYQLAALAAQILQLVGLRLLLHDLHEPGLYGRGVIGLPALLAGPLMRLHSSAMSLRTSS